MVKIAHGEAIPPLISHSVSTTDRTKLFPDNASFSAEARVERVLGNPLLTAASFLRLAYDAYRDGEQEEAVKALKSARDHLAVSARISTLTLAEVAVNSEFVRRSYAKK